MATDMNSLKEKKRKTTASISKIKALNVCSNEYPNNIFCENLKPLLYISIALGIFPLQLLPTGGVEARLVSWAMLYSLVVYSLQVVVVAFVAPELIELLYSAEKKKDFQLLLLMGLILYLTIQSLVMSWSQWYELKKIACYFNSWNDFQVMYERVMKEPLVVSVKRQATVIVGVALITEVLSVIYLSLTRVRLQWWQVIPSAFTYTLMVILVGILQVTCLIMMACSTRIMAQFNKHRSRGSLTVQIVKAHSDLWLHLSGLATDLGQAMCYTYTQQILVIFISTTISTYGALMGLGQKLDTYVMGLIFAQIFSYVVINTACYIGQKVTIQVGANTLTQVQACLPDFSHDPAMLFQLSQFLEVIVSNPPVINLGGYLTINRRLQTTFFATLASYLIILVQLQQSLDAEPTSSPMLNYTPSEP